MVEPSVGRIVHYVSYGTPGGEYPKACRAAVVTEVVTTEASHPEGHQACFVGLAVLNPSGLFFNSPIEQDEDGKAGGTWHWPERVDA